MSVTSDCEQFLRRGARTIFLILSFFVAFDRKVKQSWREGERDLGGVMSAVSERRREKGIPGALGVVSRSDRKTLTNDDRVAQKSASDKKVY